VIDEVAQPAAGGNAVVVGQEATQKGKVVLAPIGDVFEIIVGRDRTANQQKQHVRQRIGNPPRGRDHPRSPQNDPTAASGGAWPMSLAWQLSPNP